MAVADVFLVDGVQGDLAEGEGGFAEVGGHDLPLLVQLLVAGRCVIGWSLSHLVDVSTYGAQQVFVTACVFQSMKTLLFSFCQIL